MLLTKAIELFIKQKGSQRWTPRHIRHLKTRLRYFSVFVGEKKELEKITPQDIQDFLNNPYCQKLARGTYNHYIAVLSQFFKFCQDFGFISANPARFLQYVREEQPVVEYLTVEEARKLLAYRYPYKSKKKLLRRRDKIAWHLGILCGLRMSEAQKLRWENVDLESREIKVIASKNLKDRIIPLVPPVYNVLKEESERRKPKPTDFVLTCQKNQPANHETLNDALRRCLEYLGIRKKKPHYHILRHTCATLYLRGKRGKRGMDIRLVAELLGHSSVSTTQKYTHVDKTFLREEMERCLPFIEEQPDEQQTSKVIEKTREVYIFEKALETGKLRLISTNPEDLPKYLKTSVILNKN